MIVDSKTSRGVIEIAKLRHGGGCNDAPGALRESAPHRVARRAQAPSPHRSRADQHLGRKSVPLPPGVHARPARFPAYAGRARSSFTSTSSVAARCWPTRSARASRSPPRSAARSPPRCPARNLKRIPPDDPIFTSSYGGYDMRHGFHARPRSGRRRISPSPPASARSKPQLEGIKIDGRWAVIFSPYDISCALESHEAIGCRGYTQEDAARIGPQRAVVFVESVRNAAQLTTVRATTLAPRRLAASMRPT